MPGTAIDQFFAANEEQRERTRLEASRQGTGVKLIRFDDQMREVSCFDEARERGIWVEARQIVEMMRDQADQQGRRPMRLITVLASEEDGPVYRCSFGWEFGVSPQIGDILLALFVLRNRHIDANERGAHIDFLARHSCETDRAYWRAIQCGQMPTTPLAEQIRRQMTTETSPRNHSRNVATSSPSQPTGLHDIQEL